MMISLWVAVVACDVCTAFCIVLSTRYLRGCRVLRLEDKLRAHPFYVEAAKIAIEVSSFHSVTVFVAFAISSS